MEYFDDSLISLSSVRYNDVGGFSLYVTESENFISNGEIKISCSNLITSAIDGEVFFSAKFAPDGVPFCIPYRLFDKLYKRTKETTLNDGPSASILILFGAKYFKVARTPVA